MTCNSNTKAQLDPVQGLVDYILDVKPYHTKIIEVLIEYVHEDFVDVIIIDNHELKIDIIQPTPPPLTVYSCEGYDGRTFSDPFTTMILSPNQAETTVNGFVYGFNTTTNSISVLGDRVRDFIVGTTITISTFVEDYSDIHNIVDVSTTNPSGFPAPAGTGSFVVPGDQTTRFVIGSDPFEVFGSTDNNKPYTVASNSYLDAGNTVIPVHQSILSGLSSGKLGLETTVGNNSGVFTITEVLYDYGSIDSWPNLLDPSSYTFGNHDHTIITVAESLNDPLVVFTPPSQTYAASITIDDVIIEEVLDIGSNELVLVVDGNLTTRFFQGVKFEAIHESGSSTLTTLKSEYVSGKTRIRTAENIEHISTGIIKEHFFGFDEHKDICSSIPETLVRVKISEQLAFDGAIELFDDVIAYNLENDDVWGFDLPITTIIGPVEPSIPTQPTAPVGPVLNDLWFDSTTNVLRRWSGYNWAKITKAYWLDTANNQFFYRTKNSFVDTGWVLNFAETPGFGIVQPATDDTNASVSTFNPQPHQTYHSQVEPHATNDAYIIKGGNFIRRFIPNTEFDVYNFSVGGHLLGSWRAPTFPIIEVGTGTVTIDGEYQWLFQDGFVFSVRTSLNSYTDFTVQSTNSTGSGNTIITTTVAPTIQDQGVILGSVYNPIVDASDSTDQVKTIVATTTPIDVLAEGISYRWIGPLRLDIDAFYGNDVQTTIDDEMGVTHELLSLAERYQIVDTDSAANIFRIHYDDPITFLPVNLMDSFTPGTIFLVTDSYSDNNPVSSETNDATWVVKSVSWDELGTGDTIIEIETDFDNIPPYNSFTVLSVTNAGGDNQIVLQGDHTNLFSKWGTVQFRMDQPLVSTNELINIITVLEAELDAGNTVLTVDEHFIDEAYVGVIGLIDASYLANILFDDTNVTLPWEHGYVANVASAASLVTSATIEENLDFGWGSVQQWEIIATDQATSSIFMDGDITGILDVNDDVSILGSSGNDGDYEISTVTYLVGPDQTQVTVSNPVLPVDPPTGLEGYLRVDDIDITDWFQYLIKQADSTLNTFVVNGNATVNIQAGQQFRVLNNQNEGVYTVIATPTFDGVSTTIPVSSVAFTEKGGWVESYRDYGIRIIIQDTVGIAVSEDASAAVLTGGSIIDAWDYPYWDLGSFDEDLGTVIHLYSNTF